MDLAIFPGKFETLQRDNEKTVADGGNMPGQDYFVHRRRRRKGGGGKGGQLNTTSDREIDPIVTSHDSQQSQESKAGGQSPSCNDKHCCQWLSFPLSKSACGALVLKFDTLLCIYPYP